MNQEIENNLAHDENGELEEDIDVDEESDVESNAELNVSDDEYFDEIYSEIMEAVNRNAEHLQLLHKYFDNLKLELSDIKCLWFRRFFKEIEMANDTVQQVENELFEILD